MTELREEFNSRVKPHFRKTHTPQCVKCMAFSPWGKGKMEVHHIKTLLDGGTNDSDNLVVLCNDCHEEYHKYFEGKDFDEWRRTIPMWVYSAVVLTMEDKAVRNEALSKLEDLWPLIKEKRMVTTPWETPELKKYVNENCKDWIDW